MKTVKQLLDNKGHETWSIDADATVYDTVKMMAEKQIGSLLVMEGGRFAGIVSERDYARKVILMDRSSHNTPVRDIMTRRVICTQPDKTIEECMALMTDKHIRHLPVMDGEALVGMISIGDLVKTIIAEQQFMIEQLEHYING